MYWVVGRIVSSAALESSLILLNLSSSGTLYFQILSKAWVELIFTNHKSQASQVEVGIRATNLTWFSNPSCNNVSCDSPNFSPWAIVLIVIVMVILILAGLGIYFYNLVIHLPIIFGPIVWDMMLHPTSVVKTPNVCDGHQSALVFYRHQYTTKAEHVRNFDPHHDKAATFLFQRKVNFWGG